MKVASNKPILSDIRTADDAINVTQKIIDKQLKNNNTGTDRDVLKTIQEVTKYYKCYSSR